MMKWTDRRSFIPKHQSIIIVCFCFCKLFCLSDGVYQYMCGCIPNLESFYFYLFSKPTHCASHALVTRTLKPPVQDLGLQNKKP
uniref:Putative secreted protein n=1 Tax=Ixodes scapularis TaxID=6945 RepID=A0A4D5RZ90_IXOSC